MKKEKGKENKLEKLIKLTKKLKNKTKKQLIIKPYPGKKNMETLLNLYGKTIFLLYFSQFV